MSQVKVNCNKFAFSTYTQLNDNIVFYLDMAGTLHDDFMDFSKFLCLHVVFNDKIYRLTYRSECVLCMCEACVMCNALT